MGVGVGGSGVAVGSIAVGVGGTGVIFGVAGLHPLNTTASPIATLSTNKINCFILFTSSPCFYELSDSGYQLFGAVSLEYEDVGAGSQGHLVRLWSTTEGDHL